MIIELKRGRYFVGMNLPSFVPVSMVESKLSTFGLKNFRWFKRDNPEDLGKLTVTPTDDPLHTDDWNRWLEADYEGTPRRIDEKKIWSWLLTIPQ